MNKFVVVVFDNETKAYQGARALEGLHAEGSVTVYDTAVVQREMDGTLTVKKQTDQGPLGLAIGGLVGALIGMFGGPAGIVIGLAAGGALGGVRDIRHAGVSDEFLEKVGHDLTPGKFAVVAEVSEDWMAPMDTRMEAIGGRVVREACEDFVDDLVEKRAANRRAEFNQWKTKAAGSKADRMESALTAELGKARQTLQRSAEQARDRLDSTRKDMEAKITKLQGQATKAQPEVKGRIEQRITDIRREFGEREKKLRRAYEMAQEALQP